jgi:uncharacterized protein YbcI
MSRPEADTTLGQTAASAARGETLSALSDAIVTIHKHFYGKGPETARTHMHRDLVVVLLQGGFTRGEHTLSDRGHVHEVVQSRLAMQSSVEAEFRMAVESILGRSVRSFMSANDPANDLQTEIFVLHPKDDAGERGPPRAATSLDESDLTERATRARDQHRELLEEHRALRSEQEQSRRAIRERGQHE